LGERHRVAPSGVLGGENGATGSHTLIRDGVRHPLPAKTTVRLEAGDIVEVRTAGGGGFGKR
jgi:N-methylhydantoinase B